MKLSGFYVCVGKFINGCKIVCVVLYLNYCLGGVKGK